MFEKILFIPGGLGREDLDFGEVAEAMIFYGEVSLILSQSAFISLLSQVSVDDLLLLVETANLRIRVLRDILATHEAKNASGIFYDFVTVEPLRGDRTERDPREIVQRAFLSATGRPGKSRRATQRFLNHCQVSSINEGLSTKNGLPDLARDDLRDLAYVRAAIVTVISHLAPGYAISPRMTFDIQNSRDGFTLVTDLDIEAINAAHKKAFPLSETTITFALLLDFLNKARANLYLASQESAELIHSQVTSAVVGTRLQNTLAKAIPQNQLAQIALFQAEYLEGHSVRDAINSGERSVKELVAVISGAGKFRGWLKGVPHESRLIKEYTKSLVADTWAERLPAKTIRYLVFSAAGLLTEFLLPSGLATLAGQGLGLGDTFLLDKLLSGWKPNQFVENELATFLRSTQEK